QICNLIDSQFGVTQILFSKFSPYLGHQTSEGGALLFQLSLECTRPDAYLPGDVRQLRVAVRYRFSQRCLGTANQRFAGRSRRELMLGIADENLTEFEVR